MRSYLQRRGWLYLTLALILLFSLVLAACGDNPTTTPAVTTASAVTTAAQATTATTQNATTAAAQTTSAATTTAPSAGASGGTLVGAFDQGPGGCPACFNPLLATAGLTWLQKYFSPLLFYDVTFTKLQGELAEAWEVAPDGKQYTFKLRKGVTWHDGKSFTAEDVKFTFDLVLNPDSASVNATRVKDIKEVSTPDPQTVVFVLQQPNASFLDGLTYIPILPKHALESIPVKDLVKSSWWSTNPIGTGPFKWSKYVQDQYVELVANETYWRGKPKLDKLINRYYKEASAATIALRSGDIQFSYLSLDDADALKKEASLSIIAGPSYVLNYIGLNQRDPRFQNLKVRQAILLALDRKTISDQLYKGNAVLSQCVTTGENYTAKDLNAYASNLDQAKSLLKEANWDKIKGEPIDFVSYYSDQLSKDVMVTVQQMLGQIGIEVKPRQVDTPTYNQLTSTPNGFSMVFAGQGIGPDPDSSAIFMLSSAAPPNGNQRWGLNLPDLDKLYSQGKQESDLNKRPAIYQNICKMTNEQLPVLPLWIAQRFGGVSKKAGNFIWTPAPGGGRYYDAAETWTIAK
jgi:peptide/nickel transport system substrate-binding protein